MSANNKQLAGGLLAVVILVVVGFFAWSMMNAPDHRGTGQRIDDAVGQLTSGDNRSVGKKIDDATDRIGDRTPAQKLGDGMKDVGHDIQNTVK